MAEQNEKKANATLIKHHKEDVPKPVEKKKVVVVKKKVVKKSHPHHKVVARKDPEEIKENSPVAAIPAESKEPGSDKASDTTGKTRVDETAPRKTSGKLGVSPRSPVRTGNGQLGRSNRFQEQIGADRNAVEVVKKKEPVVPKEVKSEEVKSEEVKSEEVKSEEVKSEKKPVASRQVFNKPQVSRPASPYRRAHDPTGASRPPAARGTFARAQGERSPYSRTQGERSAVSKPPAERSTFSRPQGARVTRVQGTYAPRSSSDSGGFNRGPNTGTGGAPNRGGFRPQGGAPNRGGFNGPRNNRPGGGSGGAAPAPIADNQKTASKKFFKTKKGSPKTYKKKHEEHSEKAYQVKKKAIQLANPVPKEIEIMEVVTVSEVARKMNLKASDLIGKLMGMGMMVTINQQIDAETATLLAEEYDCKVKIISLYEETLIESSKDDDADLADRPPIITVMGHVDHGKTKLLDAIRQTDVVSGEFGGITQHIGAYTIHHGDRELTFLDTPGHEAFTLMRVRGAQITDVVILVVAANDGVMPQTIEALNHAKEAKVPIIVAINKIDLPDANPDKIKQQLSEYNLIPEEWGGSTLFVEISALKKQGISELIDTIILQTEMLELKANYDTFAEGKVIEAKVDQGRGIVSTVLVQKGSLSVGDSFVAGIFPGKVRAMFNDKGEKVLKATPAMPVEILGFTGIPHSGDPFQVTENDRVARQFGAKRQELKRVEQARNVKKITLANLYDNIATGDMQELKVIIKGDVHGSVEALQIALEKLSTPEVKLTSIHTSAGAIIENDVYLAASSKAIIVGFHVRPTAKAQLVADQEKVEIRKYNVIYDAVEDIRTAMEGMLSPELKEEVIGMVEVREIYKVPKIGVIAGAYVLNGIVKRNCIVNVLRDDIQLHSGKISSLKRFKDDVKEVREGYECGIGIENFNDLHAEDKIEIVQMKEVAKTLSAPVDNKNE